MSVRNTVRALPTLFKVSFAEAVAYRAEMLVWVLSTTMPLVMYFLWSAVAKEAPVGNFGQAEFLAYFLAAFIVRQLTGTWAAWQMNFEIRQGTLSMKLLRPVHVLLTYATENLAVLPMRVAVAVPAAAAMLFLVGTRYLPHSLQGWLMFGLSMLGGWLVAFLINISIGTLALFMKSSLKVMDAYLAVSFVFSGYLIPVELFPRALRAVVNFLPFRFTIGLPVELLTSRHSPEEAVTLLLRQWAWVFVLLVTAQTLWRKGLRRFEAYGG